MILSHVILSHALSLCSKSRKEKKKKRNINNDLVVLPSYDSNWEQCHLIIPTLLSLGILEVFFVSFSFCCTVA